VEVCFSQPELPGRSGLIREWSRVQVCISR